METSGIQIDPLVTKFTLSYRKVRFTVRVASYYNYNNNKNACLADQWFFVLLLQENEHTIISYQLELERDDNICCEVEIGELDQRKGVSSIEH